MAAKQVESKSRSVKKRAGAKARSRSSPPKATDPTASTLMPSALEDAIEEERARLMTAHTLLSCAAIAMDAQEIAFEGPHYQTIIEMARDLVNESINKLDSVNLDPVNLDPVKGTPKPSVYESGEALGAQLRKGYEVKEPIPKYLC